MIKWLESTGGAGAEVAEIDLGKFGELILQVRDLKEEVDFFSRLPLGIDWVGEMLIELKNPAYGDQTNPVCLIYVTSSSKVACKSILLRRAEVFLMECLSAVRGE
jgi:hypothetical protein